jgi:hypothetical protein
MSLLTDLLTEPGIARDWSATDWNRFLPLAREARLLGRIYYLLQAHDLLEVTPARIVDQLRGALAQTRYVQQQALRELRHVLQQAQKARVRVIALKGVAYLAAELPPAQWRNLSDIDVLVPGPDIDRFEAHLQSAGWQPNGDYDAYDQRYYREWMHEVPPLRHVARETEVDLHHNLAPPVSRVKIAAGRLWETAHDVTLRDGMRVGVLSPPDMLLHNAIHLFMNDELRGGLRDVMDFRDLYEHFRAVDARFEQHLVERALALDCRLPLFYAVDTASRLAGLDPAPALRDGLAAAAPARPVRWLMRRLIDHALAPVAPGRWTTAVANWLLFVRSHWIRMPLLLLLRHLLRKSLKRSGTVSSIQETPG